MATESRPAVVVLLCGVIAVATACRPAAQPSTRPSSATSQPVLVFSDLHFNPFSDPALVGALQTAEVSRWRSIFGGSAQKTYAGYGSDTNYPLLASALTAMQRAAPRPELVLIAGDFMAHGFQSSFKETAPDTSAAALAAFTAKTNQFLAQEIAATFPDTQVLPALGNNDSGCGDYMSEPGSSFLRSFAEAWRPLVERRGSATDFVETFSAAGHYTAHSPTLRSRVVVVNNVYWSPRYSNACGSTKVDPGAETMSWLNRVLAESRSRGERVWLLSHAPVGIDVFASLRSEPVVTMLQPSFAAQLISSLQSFGQTVRYSIYGHTHMTEFRVVSDTSGSPLLATQGIPAVSPLFGNNPGFFVLSLDPGSRAISDYTVHTLTNLSAAAVDTSGVWSKEYSFRETYGTDGVSARTLADVQAKLSADPVTRASFIRFYDSGSGRAGPSATNWQAYWCGIGNLDPAAFARCYPRLP